MSSTTATAGLQLDPRVGYPIYDADQHYYEAEDAMTRHLDPTFRSAVRWGDVDGRRRLVLNDVVFKRMANVTYNPIAKPAALNQFFRGNNPDGADPKDLIGEVEPIRPEYRDREQRLEVLDRQGVAATVLLPGLGLYIEEQFHRRPAMLYAVLDAYNAWLDEDWGFAFRDRMFTGPLLSLIDPEKAVRDVAAGAEKGAKFIVLRPGPVRDGVHSWSLGDPRFDIVWKALTDRDMFVLFHAADSGYEADTARWGEGEAFSGFTGGALAELLSIHLERPILETIAALIGHGVFTRHPALQVATIEIGSKWALDLRNRMSSAFGKMPQLFGGKNPLETLQEHVFIAPFYEDSLTDLRTVMPAERILLGSDWPHPEGLFTPGDYLADLAAFSADEQRRVMSENMKGLLRL
jgi:predicted TIM-barrel fold metal-dependent hydrolase